MNIFEMGSSFDFLLMLSELRSSETEFVANGMKDLASRVGLRAVLLVHLALDPGGTLINKSPANLSSI